MYYFMVFYLTSVICLSLFLTWLWFNRKKVSFENKVIDWVVGEFTNGRNKSDNRAAYWVILVGILIWPISIPFIVVIGSIALLIEQLEYKYRNNNNSPGKIIEKIFKSIFFNIVIVTIVKIIWFPFQWFFNKICSDAKDRKLFDEI